VFAFAAKLNLPFVLLPFLIQVQAVIFDKCKQYCAGQFMKFKYFYQPSYVSNPIRK